MNFDASKTKQISTKREAPKPWPAAPQRVSLSTVRAARRSRLCGLIRLSPSTCRPLGRRTGGVKSSHTTLLCSFASHSTYGCCFPFSVLQPFSMAASSSFLRMLLRSILLGGINYPLPSASHHPEPEALWHCSHPLAPITDLPVCLPWWTLSHSWACFIHGLDLAICPWTRHALRHFHTCLIN